MFCIMFSVLNIIFNCVSLNSFVIFLFSYPLYAKVARFVFRCCDSMFVFSGVFYDFVYIIVIVM
jgi:hypothetical protein